MARDNIDLRIEAETAGFIRALLDAANEQLDLAEALLAEPPGNGEGGVDPDAPAEDVPDYGIDPGDGEVD